MKNAAAAAAKAKKSVRRMSNKNSSEDRPGLAGSLNSSSVDFTDRTEHVYESETPDPVYESTELDEDGLPHSSGSIYENTEFVRGSVKKKPISQDGSDQLGQSSFQAGKTSSQSSKPSVQPSKGSARPTKGAAQQKPKHSLEDYEDPDVIMDEDYIDMESNQDQDQDNMYIDPEDLRNGGMNSSSPEAVRSPASAFGWMGEGQGRGHVGN